MTNRTKQILTWTIVVIAVFITAVIVAHDYIINNQDHNPCIITDASSKEEE